jgi:TonB family protein
VLHLDVTGPLTPRLPARGLGVASQLAASAIVHAAGALAIVAVLGGARTPKPDPSRALSTAGQPCLEVSRLVFPADALRALGAGGGGGGNRIEGPIRRAESKGPDAITLRTRKTPEAVPRAPAALPAGERPLPSIVLDALPLASGSVEQIGLPTIEVTAGGSTGPGSGGGAGTGTGTGLGAGRGPGLGRGSGGGTGGGVYRAGGAVTAPRLILEVRPKYTSDALRRRLQGTVELEVVVTQDGRTSELRVVRSLDPGGLDVEAIAAVRLWRFEPGRVAGAPVDVLVIVLLDFSIR